VTYEHYEQRYGEIRRELNVISVQIRRLTDRQDKLRRERTLLKRRVNEPPTGEKAGADSLVVPRIQLSEEIKLWLGEYEEQYGTLRGAWKELSIASKVSTKELRGIVNGPVPSEPHPRRFVTLRVADRILTATRRQDALTNGRVNVVPNPYGRKPPAHCDDE
jgi:hypothetical protein